MEAQRALLFGHALSHTHSLPQPELLGQTEGISRGCLPESPCQAVPTSVDGHLPVVTHSNFYEFSVMPFLSHNCHWGAGPSKLLPDAEPIEPCL